MNHRRYPLCVHHCTCVYVCMCVCVCASVCVYFKKHFFKGNLGGWKKGLEKKGIPLEVATQEQIYKTINLFLCFCPPQPSSLYLSPLSPRLLPSLLLLLPLFPPEPFSVFISLIQLSYPFPLLTATPSISFTLHLLTLLSLSNALSLPFYHSLSPS